MFAYDFRCADMQILDVQMCECADMQMREWADVQMRECADVRMCKFWMCRYENVKMCK